MEKLINEALVTPAHDRMHIYIYKYRCICIYMKYNIKDIICLKLLCYDVND